MKKKKKKKEQLSNLYCAFFLNDLDFMQKITKKNQLWFYINILNILFYRQIETVKYI